MEDFCIRFGEKPMIDTIKEFNKFKQEGSVIDYQARFEELRSLMMNAHPALIEDYFVSSFISGFNDELRAAIKMMLPATVKQAAERQEYKKWPWKQSLNGTTS